MATLNLETIKLIGNGVLDAKHVAVRLQADLLAEEAAVDTLQMSRVCAIIEDAMLDTMFELPGLSEINECVITRDAVNGGKPTLIAGVRRRNAKRTGNAAQKDDAKEIS